MTAGGPRPHTPGFWIEAGGVVVNDAPFFRAVQMPYGGSRDSGYGREGIRWTMQEMTEPRLLVLPAPPAVF
ncbi:MAG: aldehyde dehydrogenase family protein [Actinomycetota bacterium]